jgi:integrase
LLKPKTIQDYRQVFRLLLNLQPNISIASLTPQSMACFFKLLNERKRRIGNTFIKTGVKKSTILTYWNMYSCFFSWLVQRGYLQNNPLASLKRPHPVYDMQKFLEKEEIEKILAAIVTTAASSFLLKRNIVLFYLLLFCGLRREELLSLQTRDIDLPKKMLTVRGETSKVPRTRHIPLHSSVLLSLNDYLKERTGYTTQYLIVSTNKDYRLTSNGLRHLTSTLIQASGVKFHIHQFRHTFAVNFLKSTNNVAKLQQLLGHRDASMTLQYLRCLPPHEMRADIESMRIDNFA